MICTLVGCKLLQKDAYWEREGGINKKGKWQWSSERTEKRDLSLPSSTRAWGCSGWKCSGSSDRNISWDERDNSSSYQGLTGLSLEDIQLWFYIHPETFWTVMRFSEWTHRIRPGFFSNCKLINLHSDLHIRIAGGGSAIMNQLFSA